MADYVGWKSFTVHAALSDAEMQSPALVDRIVGFARTVMPLLEWGWAVIDDEAPAPVHDPRAGPAAAEARLLIIPRIAHGPAGERRTEPAVIGAAPSAF